MKLGILGTGMIVKDMLPMIHDLEFDQVYLLGTERSRERAAELTEQYSLSGYFTDYDKLLESGIDTVYAALPNHLHASFARKALMAGKHVILEKPAVSNRRELLELRKIAEDKGLLVMEAMNIHYLPAWQSVKENLGRLGRIRIVNFQYSQYSSRYDAFRRGEILPAFDPQKSGGALMDLNVYNIHAAVGLFGAPCSVSYHGNVERGIDTSGILTMDYGTFQVVCIGAKDCSAPLISTIQGEQGYIRIETPISRMKEYEICGNDGRKEWISGDWDHHRMYGEFKEFIRMVKEKDREKAGRMLEFSLIVSGIMDEARRQAGLCFPADSEIC